LRLNLKIYLKIYTSKVTALFEYCLDLMKAYMPTVFVHHILIPEILAVAERVVVAKLMKIFPLFEG